MNVATWRNAVVASTTCLILMTACADRPRVKDLPVVSVTTSKSPVTDEDVKNAIQRAGLDLGWTIVEDNPGNLIATKTEDDQTAVVALGYQISMYSIRYQDSKNLKYKRVVMSDLGGTIHDPNYATIDKKYNEWVDRLSQAIQAELANMR